MTPARLLVLAAAIFGLAACAATRDGGAPEERAGARATPLPEGYGEEFATGVARFEEGDLPAAERHFERALRIHPRAPEAWNALARVAYELGRMDLCLERASTALRLDPDHREARLNRGLALFALKEYRPALDDFRRILSYPVDDGKISDYSLAYREWESRSEDGRIAVPFPDAVSQGLLNVDREAMLARWYARLTSVLVAGPGFSRRFVHQTEHYRVVTDDSEELASLVARRLELILVEYSRLLPPPDPTVLDSPFAVTVFSERDDYVRYLTDILDDRATAHISGGSYHPLLRELLIAKGMFEDRTLLVLQHEGFHQYSYALLDRVPPWFGEGIADYFAPSRIVSDELTVGGQHPLRLKALRKALADPEPPDLRELMLAEPAVFMAAAETDLRRRSAVVGRNYSLAWALAHFLVEGDSGGRRSHLHAYFNALVRGHSQGDAYDAAFGAVSEEELLDAFVAHCRDVLLASAR